MKTRAALVCLLVAGIPPAARADSLCESDKDARAAEAQVARARALEEQGKWAAASDAAGRVNVDCARSPPQVKALRQRTARKAGEEAERKPDLEAAFRWYQVAESLADADRMKLAQVKADPGSEKVVSGGLAWFRQRGEEKGLVEVRAVAGRNAERALADEEKAFASVARDSQAELGRAMTWFRHAGAGEERALQRAEKRGDQLAAEDTRKDLRGALAYYRLAGKEAKGQGVREKARRLGEAHARKGEAAVAADFFAIAGDQARATETRRAGEAEAQQAEKKRQKGFEKDQAALEKELGL